MYVDENVLSFMGTREYESSFMVNETVEATATVTLDPVLPTITLPPLAELPPGGLHARIAFDPLKDEV